MIGALIFRMSSINYLDNINPVAVSLLSKVLEESCEELSVLELGCWRGALGQHCLLNFPNKIKSWIGVESNLAAAREASQRLTEVCILDLNNKLDKTIKDLLCDSDILMIVDVLEHLYAPCEMLEAISTYFRHKPVVIVLPNIGCHQIVDSLVAQDFEYQDSGILDRTHRYHFTPKSFLRLVAKYGYEVNSQIMFLRNAAGAEVRKSMIGEKTLMYKGDGYSLRFKSTLDADSFASYGFGILIRAL